jgi:acetylornithine deacetylase/succinyl-diaminopimelate desuccinylase-like protein
MRRFIIAQIIAAACLASAAERYPVDWKQVDAELLEHFTALLKIDTSNPPGNETKAVNYLRPILEKEGIEVQVLALDPNRANLVARLPGNGSKKPIAVFGHTDVVGVQREKWPVDPFAAIHKDGFIWGRGSSDDKPHVATGLMLLLMLKRMHVPLDRDVIFVAESGEEGTTGPGIDFLVNQHWSDIECEFALAEGGFVAAKDGKVRYVEITTTEKAPRTTRLVAHGTAGHGSIPKVDNPILHLSAAVAKFESWQPPMRLNDTTRAYFERLATISAPDLAQRYNHITNPAQTEEIQRYLLEHEPSNYSVLRTSIVPTIFKGGFRSNVIPSEAEATLDIRMLPDENIDQLYEQIRKTINDPAVEIVRGGTTDSSRKPSPPSRLDTEMFHAIERVQKRMYPNAITLPAMLTAATDMAKMRAKGVQAYGWGQISEESEMAVHGPHSDQERVLESSIPAMMQFLWNTVLEVAAH